jgi:Domain of unknown function (DUF4383)
VRKLVSAESLAGLIGLAFVAVGVVSFIPGPVQQYGELKWWKSGSGAELFGVFQISILHNLLAIGIGVAGLVAARSWTGARAFLTVGGAVNFAVGIYGLIVDYRSDWNFIPLNRADDWLQLGVGIAMLYAGLAIGLAALRPAATS